MKEWILVIHKKIIFIDKSKIWCRKEVMTMANKNVTLFRIPNMQVYWKATKKNHMFQKTLQRIRVPWEKAYNIYIKKKQIQLKMYFFVLFFYVNECSSFFKCMFLTKFSQCHKNNFNEFRGMLYTRYSFCYVTHLPYLYLYLEIYLIHFFHISPYLDNIYV